MSEAEERSRKLVAIRDRVEGEVRQAQPRPRFGMFSCPPAGVVCADGTDFKKIPKRGENGKPVIGPKQIYTRPTHSGQLNSSYFSATLFLQPDPRKQEILSHTQRQVQARKGEAWKPASGEKSDSSKAIFEHLSDFNPANHKSRRNTEGKVEVEPRGIYSSPGKKGHYTTTVGHTFSKTSDYMTDPYDRARELEAEAKRKARRGKSQEPYKPTGHGDKPFATDRDIYFYDRNKLPPLKEERKGQSPLPKNHDGPFVSGTYRYRAHYEGFPKWLEGTEKKIESRRSASVKKDGFKPPSNSSYGHWVSPSISLNKSNLNQEVSVLLNRSML